MKEKYIESSDIRKYVSLMGVKTMYNKCYIEMMCTEL